MIAVDTIPELRFGSLSEFSHQLEALPKLAESPFGRIYGNYLFFNVIRSVNSVATNVEKGLRGDIYALSPSDYTEKWNKLFAYDLEMLPKMLVEAQYWANKGVLYRFLTTRFAKIVEKSVSLLEAALSQLASRPDAPYTYAELDDPEEHAFFQDFTSKTTGKG